MKYALTALFCWLFTSPVFAQTAAEPISIIPQPVKVVQLPGSFVLQENTVIVAGSQPAVLSVASFLQQRLVKATGYPVKVGAHGPASVINLVLNSQADALIGPEGYYLSVTPKGATITANEPAGLFYGAQTLLQLFPEEIESDLVKSHVKWQAPAVTITDYPRFPWRGLMLDVARHFFTKDEVKAYIDRMARYKYNVFHWHLTDDSGWRVEIKSLPNLTQKGAWNVPKVGKFGTFSASMPDEPRTQGGFYTQEDIKEVVRYAQERFVNVLPEIDVPGHSMAAVASYPELSCTADAVNYQVYSGEAGFMNWVGGGVILASVDNTLCPANENVYNFLDKVFGELSTLFPFEYIHVGGDECAKNFWAKSDSIKALMQRENLKTMQEVQSYFEKRVVKIVESKGKKVIGWDEILEGGLAPGAAVMAWRGDKAAIEATKMQHDVVMSPTAYSYLDYMQGDAIVEPVIYASLRLNKAYQFDPVPAGADEKYIKGGQANLWTEQVYNFRQVQYMIWPRALAIAESVWSPKNKKNWGNFISRVEHHFNRFDQANVKYSRSMYDPIFSAKKEANGQISIQLATEIEGLEIYYTFDNTFPDRFYPKYTAPLTPPKDATTLKVITYRDQEPVGRMITMPVREMETRAGKR
ncbi:beta-N-acetylhexosaminidase [Hufsiella ginkgonis]|uniref:beta-N-acetylhexosaminidase n=1 Tax=Hufsiella ginkgonis TaxID=2695274 RepID=A0A7K1Y150_9SPHI|nr:family 20 glycosylhydrolase [Hufsiella ginkgonis]MXV16975.1 family 20 glycosylhydrolase [Hufsiella ginkgonis]